MISSGRSPPRRTSPHAGPCRLADKRARLARARSRSLAELSPSSCRRAATWPRWPPTGVARLPPCSPNRPARSFRRADDDAVGSRSSRHHVTSVTSPNVHTMAMPVPFSGSASSCAIDGHRGRRTVASTTVAPTTRGSSSSDRMRDEGHARGDQLGARRLDLDRAAVFPLKTDAVRGPRSRGPRSLPGRRQSGSRPPTSSALRP